ncbi:alpha-tocopherol transfer protein-like [Anoplophora glabripennis]|uniref:alpha-tocopherol transfer protein-like n=1 Tax=Anoplophora glabripennis TaxID=217634 RepID=UPI000874BE0A|nr:alpha-tocopherol transfer protein-like [Anoplophora glabripennis]
MDTKNLLVQDPKGQLALVLKQYNKTEENLEEYLDILRKWLKTQMHLPEMPSDTMIRNFLFNNKFSVEATKQKLDMYYTLRSLIPEIYENKNPKLPHMQQIRKKTYVCPLPKTTEDGYRVTVIKFVDEDADNFDAYDFFAHTYNIAEIRVQEDIPLSDVIIYDFEFLTMGHILKLTPVVIKKASIVLEKVFSNRVKAIHIINAPSYVDTLLSVCKQLISPKLVERLNVHNKSNSILKYLPKEIVPKDYGGDEMTLSELNDLWEKKIQEYQQRFDALEKMKPNEELRPAPLKNDDILGFYGNFKKLSVD